MQKVEFSFDLDPPTENEESERCFLEGTKELIFSIDLTLSNETKVKVTLNQLLEIL